MIHQASVFFEELLLNLIFTQICQGKDIKVLNYLRNHQSEIKATPQEECKCEVANFGGGGGPTQKKSKKSKSISGILGWVLTFFDPKF